MIRVGIVGCNFGRTVQLPAFRNDPRCEVIALAGTDRARTEQLAREAGIPLAFGDWAALLQDAPIDAVAIATPPQIQPAIALRALALNKSVFVEKPLAASLADGAAMVRQAATSGRATMIDFEFGEIAAWRRAKEILQEGGIGRLRHVVVTWNVENTATRLHLQNWKTSSKAGGGVLGNYASHCMYYLEWFCGPLVGLSARLSGLPEPHADTESLLVLALKFASGAAGSLTVSCASYLGSGHRLEFYGDEGTIMLLNQTADYARGFELLYARRPSAALATVAIDDAFESQFEDGRIAPVARLATRFLDAIESNSQAVPGFTEGYRVQELLEAARRSHESGRWLDVSGKMTA